MVARCFQRPFKCLQKAVVFSLCADGYAQCFVEHGIGCDVADEYALFDQAGEDSIWIGDFKEDEVGV